MNPPFDPAALAQRLQAAGVSQGEAQAHVEVLRDMLVGGVAGKRDVETVSSELEALRRSLQGLAEEVDGLRRDIADVRDRTDAGRADLRQGLERVTQDLGARLAALFDELHKPKTGWGARLTLWTLGLLALAGALAGAFVAGALAPESWGAQFEWLSGLW